MDASQCPALKNKNTNDSVTTETCPVVGRVSAMLPPSHPNMTDADAGKVCLISCNLDDAKEAEWSF